MAYSDRRLARTIPETDPWILSSDFCSYVCKAEHDQSVTKIISEKSPNRTRTRTPECVRPSHPRKTAKTEFLGFLRAREWPGATRFCGGMELVAEAETGPEIRSLAVEGGELDGVPRGAEIRGAGAAKIPESGPSRVEGERQKSATSGHSRPTQSI